MKRTKLRKQSKDKTAILRRKAWRVFSRWVRFHDATHQGFQFCYTCRKWGEPKSMDAGHYIHDKLDFDEMNVHPQCTKCNRFLHGNLGVYAERLYKDYGIDAVEDLRARAFIRGNQYSKEELEEIIKKYG